MRCPCPPARGQPEGWPGSQADSVLAQTCSSPTLSQPIPSLCPTLSWSDPHFLSLAARHIYSTNTLLPLQGWDELPDLDERSGAEQELADSLLPLLPDLKLHEVQPQAQTQNHPKGETETRGSRVSCLPHSQLWGSQEPSALPDAASQGQWGTSLCHLIIWPPTMVPAVPISAPCMGAKWSSLPRLGRLAGRARRQQPAPSLL